MAANATAVTTTDAALRLLEIVGILLPLVAILIQVTLRLYLEREAEFPPQSRQWAVILVVGAASLLVVAGSAAVVAVLDVGYPPELVVGFLGVYLALLAIMILVYVLARSVLSGEESGDGDTQQELTDWLPNESDTEAREE